MSDEPVVSGQAPRLQKWINSGQLLLSLITAVVAFYVSVQQNRLADAQGRLELQIKTQAKTTSYAEELNKYIEKLAKADDKQTSRLDALQIDLVDAMTSAASSKSGEIENDRLRHMPMWLALSTGNADGLRLIAGNAERRGLWLPLALQSTDRKVRETAIEVLRTSKDQQAAEILTSIFDLSDQLENPELEEKALLAMRQVIAGMKRRGDPALEPGDRVVQPIVNRIGSIRTSLRGEMAASGLSLEERAALQRRERAFTETLESFGIQEAVAVAQTSAPPTTPPNGAQQPRDNQQALKELESDDAEVRRNSRTTLSSQLDSATMSSLLERVRSSKASYRATLGAVVALRETSVNVVLSKEDVRAIVTLIGHDDATLRTNASELLMKITDPSTVKATREELVLVVRNRDGADARANQVYNAVAILGTWSRVLPDNLAEERATIEGFLKETKTGMSAAGSKWSRTAKLIEDLLELKARQQPRI